MQSESRVLHLLRNAKRICTSPWCVLGGGILVYFGKGGLDKHVLEGQPVSSAAEWAFERLLATVESPVVQMLMIPLAVLLFLFGVWRLSKQASEAERRQKAVQDELVAALRVEMKALMKLPSLIAAKQELDDDVGEIQKSLEAIEKSIESCRGLLKEAGSDHSEEHQARSDNIANLFRSFSWIESECRSACEMTGLPMVEHTARVGRDDLTYYRDHLSKIESKLFELKSVLAERKRRASELSTDIQREIDRLNGRG